MKPSVEVSALVQLACLLEATAPKPGNVSPGRPFRDTSYEDFLASAAAIGPVFAKAAVQPLGTTIHGAIEATRRWTRSNTNLGMVLLLAPLERAAGGGEAGFRERVGAVLRATTLEDARAAYTAIRLASAGGMGRVEAQDLAASPTVTLLEAMRLAADRDSVAREYVTDFRLTFEVGAPALRAARQAGLGWLDATVEAYLALLAATPDTLIARKLGLAEAESGSARAREVRAAGGVRTEPGREAVARFDADLQSAQNSRNPGTTADLTAAALFVGLIENGGP